MSGWLLNLIPWWVWAIVAAGVLLIARGWLGSWRNVLLAAMGAAGAIWSLMSYQKGWKSAKRDTEARQAKKEKEAQDAYRKIDSDGIDRDDVSDRLRDHRF